MTTETTERYLTVAEVAASIGVTLPAVYKWIKAGKLEAYQFGDAYRIPAEAWERFKAASRVKASGGGEPQRRAAG
jgi:excisionase family DNA binding protein